MAEKREITIFVDVGPTSGEVKIYRVRVPSTYGFHDHNLAHYRIKISDLITAVCEAGAELVEGKYKIDDYSNYSPGEVVLFVSTEGHGTISRRGFTRIGIETEP